MKGQNFEKNYLSFQISKKQSEEFNKNGVVIIDDFLSKETINDIRQDVEKLASPSRSLSRLSVFVRKKSPGRESFDIPDAASALRSCNLLECAIDIKDIITQSLDINDELNLKLTMLSCSSDCDPQPLKLHSDNLNFSQLGMFRAIIYLTDSDVNSGAFRYVKGTHLENHNIEHNLGSNRNYDKNKMKECIAPAGSLVLFNAYGVHGRNPCDLPRLSISFEFLPKKIARRNDSVSILQGYLSDKVISNIDLFSIEIKEKNKKQFIGDNLSEKFWCPTTQYNRSNRIYIKGIKYHLKAIIITYISSILPLKLRNKLKIISKNLKKIIK